MTEEEHSTDREGQKMTAEAQRIVKSLCLLAEKQGKSLADNLDTPECGNGACVVSTEADTGDWNILSLRYTGMVHESSFKDPPPAKRQKLMCHAVTNAVVSAGERRSYGRLRPSPTDPAVQPPTGVGRPVVRENLKEYSVHCVSTNHCQKCEELTTLYDMNICDTEDAHDGLIEVDLNNRKCSYKNYDEKEVQEYKDGNVQLKSGSTESEQSFFPLAIDDYFMTVAILSGRETEGSCCVIVTHEPPCVVSSSAQAKCPERCAVSRAHQSRVDLTKCILYTTKSPCLECTKVILQAGIRVVVHGEKFPKENLIEDLVYQTKACFKKYRCLIRVANDEDKKFLINLKESKVHAKKLKYYETEGSDQTSSRSDRAQTPATAQSHSHPAPAKKDAVSPKPMYRDFFMAMAFLARTRSKDNKTQVGACLVTPSPHRLVAMGYNGMPDGCGFKDERMDWGSKQKNYICHAELNTIIAAFRRMADLSSCTLYVTHSPCKECSKLIAQSGIKSVVFAEEYPEDNVVHVYRLFGHLPDMHYVCEEGNVAQMTINLKKLEVTLDKFESKEASKPKKGRRDVDFPLDDYFMALAVLATVRSPYPELERVGACIVLQEPRRAISVGYNGPPDDLKDIGDDYKCCAEHNAIVSAFRYHADLTNCILYTTAPPCPKCAQMIVQSGIKTVVYGNESKTMSEESDEIFYWAKVATLHYEPLTKKKIITIDLHGQTVVQTE